MANPLRLVCFDLGGVVLRICRSWREGCAAAGLDDRGVTRLPEAHAALEADYQRGRLEGAAYANAMSGLLDGVYTADEVRAVVDAWVLGPYPGVAEVVDDLHRAGLDTAVLSNTSHEHWITFDGVPAFARLRHRHASHLLGVLKPDRRAYEAVERTTGLEGDAILLVDDLPANIDGALACGWRAARIDPDGDTAAQVRRAVAAAGGLSG